MRFLPIAFAIGGAMAAVQAVDQGEEQTITMTEYTTYCPSATMSQVCLSLQPTERECVCVYPF